MLEKYMYLWMWKSCIKSLICDAGVALEQILKYIDTYALKYLVCSYGKGSN